MTTPVDRWFRAPLRAQNYGLINLVGTTQFRLRFATDNGVADYLSVFAGNVPLFSNRPELVVTCYLP